MRPLPGQPGLYSARRTAMADFSVPPPATGYTWDVKRGPPWTLGGGRGPGGLSAIPQTLIDQARANAQQLDRLKRDADPLIAGTPWNVTTYVELVRAVVSQPRSAIFRLSRADFAIVVRAVLSTASQSQILADGILSNPNATPSQVDRARRMLFAAKDTMTRLDTIVSAANAGRGALSGEARGLGDAGLIAAGVIVIIVAGIALYALFASLQTNVAAIADATEACNLDEAAGRPCTGAQYLEYLRRARQEQRDMGTVPDLAGLFRQIGSLLFWGGLLAVGGLLAYAAYTAEPARKQFAARFAGGLTGGLPTRLIVVDGKVVGEYEERSAERLAKLWRRTRDSVGSKARIETAPRRAGSGKVRTLTPNEIEALIRSSR